MHLSITIYANRIEFRASNGHSGSNPGNQAKDLAQLLRLYPEATFEVRSEVKQEEGKCPTCQCELEYEAATIEDGGIKYPVSCKCGWSGHEWYNTIFDEQRTEGE